jgi:hypothetical protein
MRRRTNASWRGSPREEITYNSLVIYLLEVPCCPWIISKVHADFILKMFIGLLCDVLGGCLISSGESGLYEVVASLLSGRVSLNV